MSRDHSVSSALLPGVDRAAFAVALAVRLRQRGVPVGFTAIENFVRALAVSPPDSLPRLYWTARISLVRQRSEIDVFDAVFAAVFGGVALALDPHARRRPRTPVGGDDDAFASLPANSTDQQQGDALPWVTLPPVVADAEESDSSLAVPERLPSDVSGLAEVPFEHLDAREMELLGTWLRSAVANWPTRRSRRLAADPRGRRIAVRATVQRSRRTGWEPLHLVRERAVDKPRRVVMLCDVSQSMQAQAPAYFHLMRALALAADAEVFAFATSLTRLTAVLTHKSAAVAIEQATDKVTDRFGGTLIATNVQALLSSHHGGAVRGAIVIIGSDGWDSDSPEALAAAMARLRRRAHRVIWMNPRASAPDFEPRVAGMAAALPYCDRLLPADTFRSLHHVITEISRAGYRI
ncbi:VWA domain-containing protein [Streptosporangium sp. 'caverna']|uniref:vWA domain-containing protein n=1 Tax=Streptosporangium sp. 'caverna' TaxID=2202249 RepID=UPI0019550AFE|nr:VWA domain-containing protein [Streptosporangium sp. 'caverna']